MVDRGLMLTMQAMRRQLAAMPHDSYLIRLIHQPTRRAFPGERLWTATQLLQPATVGFLRIRNREGCDVYIQPYAGDRNAGYILVDLDRTETGLLGRMRRDGHDPCVVLQTSPGHLQAWIQASSSALEPAIATAAARQLARNYGGDLASADWRHLGRLAGFTNQKPTRRRPDGWAAWVKVVYACAGVAPGANRLLQSVLDLPRPTGLSSDGSGWEARLGSIPAAEAAGLYHNCMSQWRISQRFAEPDWSIVDFWVARHLLRQGMPAIQVETILRLASPRFPRRHGHPDDYLHRTLARARAAAFPPVSGPV